jgi:phosphopantetheine adenylyltransferase
MQDNITEMHIYVKYEIVSFMCRQFSSLKVYIKIGQNRNKNFTNKKRKQKTKQKTKTKNKTKVGVCTKTVCHF